MTPIKMWWPYSVAYAGLFIFQCVAALSSPVISTGSVHPLNDRIDSHSWINKPLNNFYYANFPPHYAHDIFESNILSIQHIENTYSQRWNVEGWIHCRAYNAKVLKIVLWYDYGVMENIEFFTLVRFAIYVLHNAMLRVYT